MPRLWWNRADGQRAAVSADFSHALMRQVLRTEGPAALDAALAFMPLKPASEMIANLTGVSRKDVYARGLEKKNG